MFNIFKYLMEKYKMHIDEYMLQGPVNSFLRKYHLDIGDGPINVSELAAFLEISIFESPELQDADVMYFDFKFNPTAMPEIYKQNHKFENQEIIIVNVNLPAEKKFLSIASMIVLTKLATVETYEEIAQHKAKKEIKIIKFFIDDLRKELKDVYIAALYLLLPQSAVCNYLIKNKLSVKEVISNEIELDKFCLYFLIDKKDAIKRLQLVNINGVD